MVAAIAFPLQNFLPTNLMPVLEPTNSSHGMASEGKRVTSTDVWFFDIFQLHPIIVLLRLYNSRLGRSPHSP